MSKNNNRPITPTEIENHKETTLPHVVYKAFNKLISRNYNFKTKQAIISQEAAVELIVEYSKDEEKKEDRFTREDIFKNNLLDVEWAYREAGWVVNHHKPVCESSDATFEFRKRD